ncbi:MAG TPA: hypothetical protein VNK24_09305 [Elusimicrobiota bacterium]|nr:hypothetical protein [Elusimicrobiota bacterium]
MSDSPETHEACCHASATPYPCPICGNAGRKVSALTLDHHLPQPLRAEFRDEGTFCLSPECEIVYCNPAGRQVRRGETVLPVTIKDAGDDVHVCYCFDFKRSDLRRELEQKGRTEIPNQIRKGVKDGRCDCERKNPQGACCLGNVAAAIKDIQKGVKR